VSGLLGYDISWDEGITRILFRAILPPTIEGRQTVSGIEYSVRPTRLYTNKGKSYAEYSIDTSDYPERRFSLSVRYTASLTDANLPNSEPWGAFGDASRFLLPEPNIESGDLRIRDIAESLRGSDPMATIRNVRRYVGDRISTATYGTVEGALEVLDSRSGDCTEYGTLAATLLRALGMPTMVAYGVLVETGEFHAWNEIDIPGRGWLPVDMTAGEYELDHPQFHYVYFSPDYYGDDNLGQGALSYCRYESVSPEARVVMRNTSSMTSGDGSKRY
jgi:transglutaminase-like putative cysteine protease